MRPVGLQRSSPGASGRNGTTTYVNTNTTTQMSSTGSSSSTTMFPQQKHRVGLARPRHKPLPIVLTPASQGRTPSPSSGRTSRFLSPPQQSNLKLEQKSNLVEQENQPSMQNRMQTHLLSPPPTRCSSRSPHSRQNSNDTPIKPELLPSVVESVLAPHVTPIKPETLYTVCSPEEIVIHCTPSQESQEHEEKAVAQTNSTAKPKEIEARPHSKPEPSPFVPPLPPPIPAIAAMPIPFEVKQEDRAASSTSSDLSLGSVSGALPVAVPARSRGRTKPKRTFLPLPEIDSTDFILSPSPLPRAMKRESHASAKIEVVQPSDQKESLQQQLQLPPPSSHPHSTASTQRSKIEPTPLPLPQPSPDPNSASQIIRDLSEQDEELFASAKDEPAPRRNNDPSSASKPAPMELVAVVTPSADLLQHTEEPKESKSPSQGFRECKVPLTVPVVEPGHSTMKFHSPPMQNAEEDEHMTDVPDPEEHSYSCDEGEFPGFIQPDMQVYARPDRTQQQQAINPIVPPMQPSLHPSQTAMSLAAASAVFPVTPASTNSSHTTPPQSPLHIVRTLQAVPPGHPSPVHESPRKQAVSPPRILVRSPPSHMIVAKTQAHWSITLGEDISGSSIGNLLVHALQGAHMIDGVEYESYAAFLEQKLQENPSTRTAMTLRTVTPVDLMSMYPPTTMPHPPLKWETVVPPPPDGRKTKFRTMDLFLSKSKDTPTAAQKLQADSKAAAALHAATVAAQFQVNPPKMTPLSDAFKQHQQQLMLSSKQAKTSSSSSSRGRTQRTFHTPKSTSPKRLPNKPAYTPTRRLDEELRHVSEEPDTLSQSEHAMDRTNPVSVQSSIVDLLPPLPPNLSEPPELERQPVMNLYSEPQPMDIDSPQGGTKREDVNMQNETAAVLPLVPPFHHDPRTPPLAQGSAMPSPMSSVSRPRAPAESSSPAPMRTAADFLSPPRPRTTPSAATDHHFAIRTPIQVPATPIVTISPLTAPTSNGSGGLLRTPPPGQPTRLDEQGNVQMHDVNDGMENRKRRGDDASRNQPSKRARGSDQQPSAGAGMDTDEIPKPVAASSIMTGKQVYKQAKRKLQRRGAGVKREGPKRGEWLTTKDGERQYVCREDGQVYSGLAAQMKLQEDEATLMRRRMLRKKREKTVDLTNVAEGDTAQGPPADAVEVYRTPLHALSAWNIPDAIAETYKSLGVPSLYDWQVECLQKPGVLEGRSNLVYSASTSAGKTLVAEILMLNRMLNIIQPDSSVLPTGEPDVGSMHLYNRKVVFVLPYVSIVDEKTRDLSAKLSRLGFCIKSYHGQQSAQQQEGVGGAAGSNNLNSITPEIDVAVVVIEKAGTLWDNLRSQNRLGEICAVVIDELHMISSNATPLDSSQRSSISVAGNASSTSNRGYLLELLLTKVIQYNRTRLYTPGSSSSSTSLPPVQPIQIIGMSATLPNMDLFANWLQPCQLYHTNFRPVPLKEYILFNKELYQKVENHTAQQLALSTDVALVNTPARPIFAPRFRFEKVRDVRLSNIALQVMLRGPALDKQSQSVPPDPGRPHPPTNTEKQKDEKQRESIAMLVDLCEETGGGVLVFCQRKVDVEEYAKLIAKGIKRRDQVRQSGVIVNPADASTKQRTLDGMFAPRPGIAASRSSTAAPAVAAVPTAAASSTSTTAAPSSRLHERLLLLHRLASLNEGIDPTLERTIPHGVGFHHAGLTGGERLLVETAFRNGVLNILCCTSTLAAGVNLPARRVIFNGPKLGVRLLTITEYQQMSGRAGRTNQDSKGAEGSSILVVHTKDDFENIKAILNQQLPELKSALDMESGVELLPNVPDSNLAAAASSSGQVQSANLYLSHGILDAIVSYPALKIEVEDIQRYLIHTLLAFQQEREEQNRRHFPFAAASSSISPLRARIDASLRYLSSNGLIDARTNCATQVGAAITEAGLNPYDGLRVYHELKAARQNGLNLSSSLHVCWLLTAPVSAPPFQSKDAEMRWERMKSRWLEMSQEDRAACQLLNEPQSNEPLFKDAMIWDTKYHDHIICKLQKWTKIGPSPRHLAYLRLWEAMILQDLLNDAKPIKRIHQATDRRPGDLQLMLRTACLLCNQMIVLCEKLHWRDLALLFESYRDRFAYNGAPLELMQLLRIPDMKMRRARELYQEGYATIEQIVNRGSPETMFRIFLKHQPFRMSHGSKNRSASQVTRSTNQQQAHTRVLMEQATKLYENARLLLLEDAKRKLSIFQAL